MRRLVGVGFAALVASGCTSVKMVQRDGCWVRRTEKPFGRVLEEVGPCKPPPPHWSDDRLTRLVQECVAEADYRAETRALQDFSRRFSYPAPGPRKEEGLRACLEEVRSGMDADRDRAELERKLAQATGERDQLRDDAARERLRLFAEITGERDALRQDAERERARAEERDDKRAEWLGKSQDKLADWLGKSQDRMAESLGQAAQKPPGNATATATANSNSDGKATTTNDTGATVAADSGASSPPMPAPISTASLVVPGAPAAPPAVTGPAPSAPAATPASATTASAQPPSTPPRRRKTARARRTASPIRPVAADRCQQGGGDATAAAATVPPCTTDGGTPTNR